MMPLKPERVIAFTIELIFVLLGAVVVWLGVTSHIFFNRRGLAWIILSAVIVLWGLRSLYKPGQWWLRRQILTRGVSLVLLGMVMLCMAWAPFLWAGRLLAAGGVILAVRGIVGAALALSPR